MRPDYTKRIHEVRRALARKGWDALLVTHLPNVRYLCGFTGSNAALMIEGRRVTLFTDGRYTVQAKSEAEGCRIVIPSVPLLAAVGGQMKGAGRVRVGIEADCITLAQAGALRRAAGSKVRCVASTGVVAELRAVKDEGEIRAIRAAARLISRVFEEVLPKLRPGVSEKAVAAEVDHTMRRLGAEGPSFETIVASGPRAALPHARPTDRKLRRGEFVILDMGAILGGYCSDLTRTVYLGKAGRRAQAWYAAVWGAHQAARDAVKPGVACGQVDEAARVALRRHKLDRYFTHSTGHGIGLEIHEGPRLARGQKAPLAAGNVVTIEPGIYVEGVGGIRIEDDILVTPQGPEVLTEMRGDLLQL